MSGKNPLMLALLMAFVSPGAFSCTEEAVAETADEVDALVALFDESKQPDCG